MFKLFHSLLSIALGLFGIGLLVGIHELGHFIFCKLFKIATPTFSIGMGPQVFKKKIGDTVFAISAIPFGGYVEIAGLAEVGQGDQLQAKRADEYSYASKPYYQKILVLGSGVLFNVLLAYLIFSLLFWTGFPRVMSLHTKQTITKIQQVLPDSPANKAGIQPGDTITKINNTEIHNILDLNNALEPLAGKDTTIVIQRNNQALMLHLIPGERELEGKKIGLLGVEFLPPKYGLIQSIGAGISTANQVVLLTANAFKKLFTRKDSLDNVGGPVILFAQTFKEAGRGIKLFLLFLAFISINLAVINLIPLPITDGGQILFTTIEAIIRRSIPDTIKEIIYRISWLLIIVLMLLLTVRDIKRLGGFNQIQKLKSIFKK